ncbi:MAG TPA: anti-sigma factor [Thermoanaerobaculia bacterium]|nr:anti-sigma factor [Thermoanaerobaculia bacterium]
MNATSCPRTAPEVAAYLDGELDLAHAVAFERHLEECPACARELAAQEALRGAIQDHAAELRFHPTPAQTERLRRAVRQAGGPAEVPAFRQWRQLSAIAALLLVAVTSWSLGRLWPPRPAAGLAEEVVAGHVRSLLAGHPADVASTDRHTVKPWFTGKLDYAPAVIDLAGQGFPLIGGRLDYLGHHPVAGLVYRSDRHVISLYTWPAAYTEDRAGPVPEAATRQGFHLRHWTRNGMAYWAVSDVEEDRLSRFARLLAGS